MSDFYSSLADDASDLIAEYGQAGTIRRTSAGIYDPATGSATGETTTDYPCSALGLTKNKAGVALADGTLVSEADRYFMVESDTAPAVNDRLVLGATTLAIQSVRPLAPGGIALFYEVRARG